MTLSLYKRANALHRDGAQRSNFLYCQCRFYFVCFLHFINGVDSDRGVENDGSDGVDKAGEFDTDECGAGGDNFSYYLIVCKKRTVKKEQMFG